MQKLTAVFLLGAVAAALCARAEADIIPPIGLAPGSEYQLVFVTADTTTATSTDITTYNTFVQNEAALNASLPSATWTAIGSTATVSASVNAPNDFVDGSYLPVYNTQGLLVTAAGLYSNIIPVNAITYTQMGNPTGSAVWTGTSQVGSAEPGTALGSESQAQVGISNDGVNPGWLSEIAFNPSGDFPLYALSSALVATPEPTSVTLLGSAMVLLAGFRLLKKRRAA